MMSTRETGTATLFVARVLDKRLWDTIHLCEHKQSVVVKIDIKSTHRKYRADCAAPAQM